jgi:hypothetical protein
MAVPGKVAVWFTHYCATRRSGSGFVLGRKPVRKRMRAKLREIKEQLMAIRHEGTERQGRWGPMSNSYHRAAALKVADRHP